MQLRECAPRPTRGGHLVIIKASSARVFNVSSTDLALPVLTRGGDGAPNLGMLENRFS